MGANQTRLCIALAVALLPCGTQAGERFVPGQIFTTEARPEGCQFGQPEWIRVIEPRTGASWFLADDDDGLCTAMGLTFTPDGTHLRVANYTSSTIMDFDPAGNGEIIYDRDDALRQPGSSNGLTFDAAGNFYVINGGDARILKFFADGRGPVVFADHDDGLIRGGGLAFSSSGDLFVAQDRYIFRFDPDGMGTVFDDLGRSDGAYTLVFDPLGNLFVGAVQFGPNEKVFRYDDGQADSRRILADGFDSARLTLTLSPDQRELYLVVSHYIWGIDVDTGATRVVFQFPDGGFHARGNGIAVFVPPLPGDINGDEVVDVGDHAVFVACMGGPGVEEPPDGCDEIDFRYADLDFDYDVDIKDFTLLAVAMGN